MELGAVVTVPVIMMIFRHERRKVEVAGETEVRDYFPTVLLVANIALLIGASFIKYKPSVTNGLICLAVFAVGAVKSAISSRGFKPALSALRDIDKETILLLAGLFIVIRGITNAGIGILRRAGHEVKTSETVLPISALKDRIRRSTISLLRDQSIAGVILAFVCRLPRGGEQIGVFNYFTAGFASAERRDGTVEKHTGKKKFDAMTALALVLLAVFLVSAGMVVAQLVREKREEDAFTELARRLPDRPARAERRPVLEQVYPGDGETQETTEPPDGGNEAQEPPVQEVPAPAELYGELAAENGDFFGWVSIDGTEIDYPVMYTPKRPEYYLRRAFDKTSSTSGTPFLDGRCTVGCGNYIVYGHRMKNGTMFFDLLNYADEAFWREHPVVCFDTLDEYGDYEILAAFYSRIYSAIDEDVFRYYQYTDLTDEAVFDEYLQNVRAAALYDTGVEAKFGDQLLTLSTCSYHTEDGRFVVVARRLED